MVNKKVVIIATVMMLILMGAFFGWKVYIDNHEEKYKEIAIENKEIKQTVVKEETNTVTENDENSTNEISNTDSTNTISSDETDKQENQIQTPTPTPTPKKDSSQQDTALKLAKEKWGAKKASVYFYVEDEVSSNVYIISVRDNDTTEELMSYKVDVENKTVKEN